MTGNPSPNSTLDSIFLFLDTRHKHAQRWEREGIQDRPGLSRRSPTYAHPQQERGNRRFMWYRQLPHRLPSRGGRFSVCSIFRFSPGRLQLAIVIAAKSGLSIASQIYATNKLASRPVASRNRGGVNGIASVEVF